MALGTRVCIVINTVLNIDNYHLVYLSSASINSPENQAVMKILLKEVKGLNPSFEGRDIRGKSSTTDTCS